MKDKIALLQEKTAQAILGGGQKRIDSQHAKGKRQEAIFLEKPARGPG